MADVTARSLQYEYKAVRVGPGKTPGRELSGAREAEEGSVSEACRRTADAEGRSDRGVVPSAPHSPCSGYYRRHAQQFPGCGLLCAVLGSGRRVNCFLLMCSYTTMFLFEENLFLFRLVVTGTDPCFSVTVH